MAHDAREFRRMRIVPFEGVGPIKFGMTRSEVIKVVGQPISECKSKFSWDGRPIEMHSIPNIDGTDCHFTVAYCGPGEGKLDSLEFHRPSSVMLRGQLLLNGSMTNLQVVKFLTSQDSETRFDLVRDRWIFEVYAPGLGLSMYSEEGELDDSMSTLLVYDKEYERKSSVPENLKTLVHLSGLLKEDA